VAFASAWSYDDEIPPSLRSGDPQDAWRDQETDHPYYPHRVWRPRIAGRLDWVCRRDRHDVGDQQIRAGSHLAACAFGQFHTRGGDAGARYHCGRAIEFGRDDEEAARHSAGGINRSATMNRSRLISSALALTLALAFVLSAVGQAPVAPDLRSAIE